MDTSLSQMIRRHLARVPMDIRREWTPIDVERWWQAVRYFKEFQNHRELEFPTVARYCGGLYGERATSDITAAVHIR